MRHQIHRTDRKVTVRGRRNFSAPIVAVRSGALIERLAGLLPAFYAVASVTPSYPAIHQSRIVTAGTNAMARITTVHRIAADAGAAQARIRRL